MTKSSLAFVYRV